MVYIALVVPRSKLRCLTGVPPNDFGSHGIHLSVRYKAKTPGHCFCGLQCFFGSIRPSNPDNLSIDVEEDAAGWAGESDLIIRCAAPDPALLQANPKNLTVSLVFDLSSRMYWMYSRARSQQLVHECGLRDKGQLWLLRDAPALTNNV